MNTRLLVASLSLICAAATAADGMIATPEKGWVQFRGPHRDGICDETGLLKTWPKDGPKLLWKTDELGKGWSAPIIVGDSVFLTGDVGDELHIYCLDLQGKQKWKTINGKSWKESYPGSRASCAYSDGVLYHINAHGRLVALDPKTGKEQWSVDILERFDAKNVIWGITECPLIDGQRLIVTPGGSKGMMAALNKKTGETVWASEAIEGDRAAYSSPILFQLGKRRLISTCSARHGFGVDADSGKLLWKVRVENQTGATCASPVVNGNQIFYSCPTGTLGALYALEEKDGGLAATEVWRSSIEPLQGGAILKDGLLFANTCAKAKAFHCVDWKTGESRYSIKLAEKPPQIASAAMIWAEDRFYVLTDHGSLNLLKSGEKEFEVCGQIQAFDPATKDAWSHPVLLDGKLYLRHHSSLWCYDVKG